MNALEHLEQQVLQLSPDDLAKFRACFRVICKGGTTNGRRLLALLRGTGLCPQSVVTPLVSP